ncbi:hypothetical protein DITRI_Ditri16bG0091400 [Diplodiscus trichospermus]
MVSEDFSFPKIKNPLPQFTSLPSLWRVSSLAYPEEEEEEDEDDDHDHDHEGKEDADRQVLNFQRKSFSISYLLESESNNMEKMDMLWEEFNEELKRVSSLSRRGEARVIYKFKAEPSRKSSVELYNHRPQPLSLPLPLPQPQPQALKMSKPNIGSGVFYNKRHTRSMSVVMKTLKNIFYLPNLVWERKRSWEEPMRP